MNSITSATRQELYIQFMNRNVARKDLNLKAMGAVIAAALLLGCVVTFGLRAYIDFAFQRAVTKGDKKEVRRFALLGADVNSRGDDELTPLMLFSLYGDDDTCRILLGSGARTDAQVPDGSTALWYALANRNASTVRLLLLSGAKPASPADADRYFETACDLADESSVQLLLAHGVRPVDIKALSARAKRHVSISGGDVEAMSRRICRMMTLAR
jgi:ankyrin repeat protein